MHVHVEGPKGEAKFWLLPVIELAEEHGLGEPDVRTALRVIKEHEDEIRKAWTRHFGG